MALNANVKLSSNTLLLLIRDKLGTVVHAEIGSAYLDAEGCTELSVFPPDENTLCFEELICYTPAQAQFAYEEIASLGDVPIHPSYYAPTWYRIRDGIKAIDGLLAIRERTAKARRLITPAVLDELLIAKSVLSEHDKPRSRFYFAELQPGEDLAFAGERIEASGR